MKYSLLDITNSFSGEDAVVICAALRDELDEIRKKYEQDNDISWALSTAALCGCVFATLKDGALTLTGIKPE